MVLRHLASLSGISAVATGVILCLAGVTGTLASPAAFVVRVVTGPSPFARCSTFGTDANFVNASVEPWIAVNPKTLNTGRINLIGVWQQDRWAGGASHGISAAYSLNGGTSWKETPLPFSRCAKRGLGYERASDPWVSIGPDGTAYAVGLSFSPDTASSAIVASASRNGGKTWSKPKIIRADNHSNRYFNDKESVTADPTHRGTAYVVWDRTDATNNAAPTMFSKTTNGGKTWSSPRVILSAGRGEQTVGNVIVVNRKTHVLFNVFAWISPAGNVALEIESSSNGGKTWSAGRRIADVSEVDEMDPVTRAPLRIGDVLPEPAIDPRTGALYVTWVDSRFSGTQNDVAFAVSRDNGVHWTSPIRVNPSTSQVAFTPSIAVARSGAVGVTYYDFRDARAGEQTIQTDYWLAVSTDGGSTFSREVNVAKDFDMRQAPRVGSSPGAYFLGDYEGLATAGSSFLPFFARSNSQGSSHRTDILFASIHP